MPKSTTITLRLFFQFITCVWLGLFSGLVVSAQTPLELGARSELNRRGISEDELKAKLAEKGVSVDNLTPEKAIELQSVIERAVLEIEQEKRAKAQKAEDKQPAVQKNVIVSPGQGAKMPSASEEATNEVRKIAAKSSKDIAQKIKDGATVEEAVSESLQEEVADATTTKVGVYGQELFKNKALDIYRATKDAKPPDNYILGIGDELSVIIFGASQGDFRYEINEDGYINPQGMGKIFLKGVPYGKAKELVRSRFSRNFLFRDDQFVMHLATARTVSVNIFGEVENPGTFAISSINTAFNALVAAGGPTEIGSVRKIKVTRANVTKELDVYAFMHNPSLQYDFYLENNDIIQVPVAEKWITVQGAVNRPQVYELKSGENLKHALAYAGGLKPDAYKNSVQVTRIVGKRSVIQEVDLDVLPDFDVQNGDIIIVRRISNMASNTVSVEGEVDFPGTFAFEEHTDLASLVFRSVPKRTARMDLAILFRRGENGKVELLPVNLDEASKGVGTSLLLKPEDKLLVYKLARFVDSASIQVSGAVREPDIYVYGQKSHLSDYLNLSGGLTDEAFDIGYVIRTKLSDKSKEYLRIEPKKAISNPESKSNIVIEPFDEIRILSNRDFRDSAYIRISGAVNRPVILPYGISIFLADALNLAGGLRLESKKGRIDIFSLELGTRERSRTLQNTFEVTNDDNIPTVLLQPYDEIMVRPVPEFSMLRKVQINGEVRYPGEYAILKDNERISDLITKAGGLTDKAYPTGGRMTRSENGEENIVATRIDLAVKQPGNYADLVLQDGDVLYIPQSLDLVEIYTENTQASVVLGKTELEGKSKISAAYKPGKRSRWYVREYVGGVGPHSGFKHLRVQYANGRIKKSRNFGLFTVTPKVSPGAKLVLNTSQSKADKKNREPRKPLDWDKAFTQTLAFLSATATVILAISAINR